MQAFVSVSVVSSWLYLFLWQCGVEICYCGSRGPAPPNVLQRSEHKAYRQLCFDTKYFSKVRSPQLCIAGLPEPVDKFPPRFDMSLESPAKHFRFLWEGSKFYCEFVCVSCLTVTESPNIDCTSQPFSFLRPLYHSSDLKFSL